MRFRLLTLMLVAALAVFVTACGEDRGESTSTNGTSTNSTTGESESAEGGGGEASEGGNKIEVKLTEWGIAPAVTEAKAGEIKFDAKNEGKVPHELVVLKTDTPADGLKVDGAAAKEEGDNIGEAEDIGPTEEKDVEADLEPGHYVLICNLPGHYQQGMHADFTVK